VVLTGSNRDGAKGVSLVKEYGGYVIVQDPLTAESKTMPEAALALSQVDRVLPLEEIPLALAELSGTL
jgi:two-component system chemotaxis response regulator CheB